MLYNWKIRLSPLENGHNEEKLGDLQSSPICLQKVTEFEEKLKSNSDTGGDTHKIFFAVRVTQTSCILFKFRLSLVQDLLTRLDSTEQSIYMSYNDSSIAFSEAAASLILLIPLCCKRSANLLAAFWNVIDLVVLGSACISKLSCARAQAQAPAGKLLNSPCPPFGPKQLLCSQTIPRDTSGVRDFASLANDPTRLLDGAFFVLVDILLVYDQTVPVVLRAREQQAMALFSFLAWEEERELPKHTKMFSNL